MTIKNAHDLLFVANEHHKVEWYNKIKCAYVIFNYDLQKTAEKTGYSIKTVEHYTGDCFNETTNKIFKNLIEWGVIDQYYAYIMKTTTNGLIKVGYSKNPDRRTTELARTSKFHTNYQILKTWGFNNCEDGYEMEIWLHRYFKAKGFKIDGNDHFWGREITNNDISILDEKAKEIKENSRKWLDNLNFV